MGLFALSLIIGIVVRIVDEAHPAIRHALLRRVPQNPMHLGVLIAVGTIGVMLLYACVWLRYYDVTAPSNDFRLFVLLRRLLQFLPLMLAAAAVGYAAARWLRLVVRHDQEHIIVHGIGVGGAALLVFALFIIQDSRLFGLVRSVNTPVFSLEFKLAESARPFSFPQNPQPAVSAGESDPVILALKALDGLAPAIGRDIASAEALSGKSLDGATRTSLNSEADLYAHVLSTITACALPLRQRVRDTDPLLFLDKEFVRNLRVANRFLLADQLDNFRRTLDDALGSRLPLILKNISKRHEELQDIKPVFGTESELTKCHDLEQAVNWEMETDGVRARLHAASISADTPYFTLMVAALLYMSRETLAAIEEIDAWLNRARTKSRTMTLNSPERLLAKLMQLRADWFAAHYLANDASNDVRLVSVSVRRYRRAVDTIQELLFFSSVGEAKTGVTLLRLTHEVDRRRSEIFHAKSVCRTMVPALQRLSLAALGMLNSLVYFSMYYDLLSPGHDQGEIVRDYHEVLGFVEPSCFASAVQYPDGLLLILPAFVDTYLFAKLSLIRQLPDDRARSELCAMSGVVARAEDYAATLDQQATVELARANDLDAEAKFGLSRSLKRSIAAFNQWTLRLDARAC